MPNTELTINQRLVCFFKGHLSLTVAAFSRTIGVTRQAIDGIEKGNNTPSINTLSAIIQKYPELNIRWLLLGEGEMLHTQIPSTPAPHALIHQSANYTNGNLSQQAANQDNGWREAIAAKDDLIQMLKAETKRLQTELDNFKNNCAKE